MTEGNIPVTELLVYSLSRQTLLLELFTIIGVDSTLKLIRYFSGGTIEVPAKNEVKQQIRQIILYDLYRKGYTIHKLRKEFNISLNEKDLLNCINRIKELEKTLVLEKFENTLTQTMSKEELLNFVDSIEKESLNVLD